MRKALGRLVLIGVGAGAGVVLRNYLLRGYLKSFMEAEQGDVQITLRSGDTVEPGSSTEAQEFVDIARKILEIGRQDG